LLSLYAFAFLQPSISTPSMCVLEVASTLHSNRNNLCQSYTLAESMSEKRKGQHKQGLLENQTERRRGRAAENRAAKREGALAKRRRSVDTAAAGTEELVEGGEARATYAYTEAELAEAVKGVCGPAASALPHLTNLRKVLATEDPPVQEVIDAGAVPKLLLLLEHSDDRYKTEAVRCIANIASGDKHHTSHVLDGAPLLLSFLSAPSAALQEEALYAIGNIAGDTQECRDMLIAQVCLSLTDYTCARCSNVRFAALVDFVVYGDEN
jgi:Armadillo/beta-catenin-like repeat